MYELSRSLFVQLSVCFFPENMFCDITWDNRPYLDFFCLKSHLIFLEYFETPTYDGNSKIRNFFYMIMLYRIEIRITIYLFDKSLEIGLANRHDLIDILHLIWSNESVDLVGSDIVTKSIECILGIESPYTVLGSDLILNICGEIAIPSMSPSHHEIDIEVSIIGTHHPPLDRRHMMPDIGRKSRGESIVTELLLFIYCTHRLTVILDEENIVRLAILGNCIDIITKTEYIRDKKCLDIFPHNRPFEAIKWYIECTQFDIDRDWSISELHEGHGIGCPSERRESYLISLLESSRIEKWLEEDQIRRATRVHEYTIFSSLPLCELVLELTAIPTDTELFRMREELTEFGSCFHLVIKCRFNELDSHNGKK